MKIIATFFRDYDTNKYRIYYIWLDIYHATQSYYLSYSFKGGGANPLH